MKPSRLNVPAAVRRKINPDKPDQTRGKAPVETEAENSTRSIRGAIEYVKMHETNRLRVG